MSSVWTAYDDLMDEESDDDIPSAKVTPPSQQPAASKPLSITLPTAPQFSTVLRIVRLLCTIVTMSLRADSATFPHVEIPTSSIIIAGFTVCGVHSLWSTWCSMTSIPSNIHVSRCFLLLYKLSSSCNSAPPQPLQRLLPWVMLPKYWAKPNPAHWLLLWW